ncbi:hypothetical protein [Paenibacillus sp. FSL K6-1230]|uniref:hypothetical protein n=1 Tax=Paenibacillus sp. FSL K6-1230 TaxID=2921603 RepID=UPI0030F656D4
MSHTYRVLTTDDDFLVAALSQCKVYVVKTLNDQMMEIIEYGGHVEKYTPESIKIDGSYFFRDQYEFRTDIKSSTG